MKKLMNKSYNEMLQYPTFMERFEYLKLGGKVSERTFGGHRYLNQYLYHCKEWASIRNEVILRDEGCDLGDPDRPIGGKVLVHHINPITVEDILNRDPSVFDLNNLVCVSKKTHDAIHYGNGDLLKKNILVERHVDDTCPWRYSQ